MARRSCTCRCRAAPRHERITSRPPGTPPTVYVCRVDGSSSRGTCARRARRAVTYPDLRWQRCDLKTVNLLGNVLARQVAAEAGAYEAILHRDGFVTEGAATNAFAVIDGVLRTHPLNQHILPGITRQVIVELMREHGIALVEEAVTESELRRAEELFVCGSTTDVTPVILARR